MDGNGSGNVTKDQVRAAVWVFLAFSAAVFFAGLLSFTLSGCAVPAVLTDQDWQRLEQTVKPALSESEWQDFKKDLESRTMTPEEFERWRNKLSKDVADVLKSVVDVTPAPGPVKEPVKDLLEYATYALVAAWLGGKGLKQGKDKLLRQPGGKKR